MIRRYSDKIGLSWAFLSGPRLCGKVIAETNRLIVLVNDLEKKTAIIPIVGHVFEADFGAMTFHLHFETDSTMILTEVRGPQVGLKQTVNIKKVEIRPNVYLVYWQEADKTAVTDLQDYENQVVYANITTPNSEFLNLKGTLKPIK